MAAGNWIMFDQAKKYLADGTIDFDTDTIKMALLTSSWTPALTPTVWATISGNEVANANGYTTGGATVAGTATATGSTTKLSASADTAWTASGGSITARFAVLYKSGTANSLTNPVIGYLLLDTTPADVTVTAGNALTIQRHANGFWQITGATS